MEQEVVKITGASLVDQYPITLVHIVGFKIIKNSTNILQVLGGMRGLRCGDRVIYKDLGIKMGGGKVLSIGRGFQQKYFGSIFIEIKGIL